MFQSKVRSKFLISISITVGIVVGLLYFSIDKLSSYLSVTKKVEANILLVEGWLPNEAIDMAYAEFFQNNYDLLITTGLETSQYEPDGLVRNAKKNIQGSIAETAKVYFLFLGLDSAKIIAVPVVIKLLTGLVEC